MSRRYVMAQAAICLSLFAFMPIPVQAEQAATRTQPRNRATQELQDNRAGRTRDEQPAAPAVATDPAVIREAATAAVAAASLPCQVVEAGSPGMTGEGVIIYEVACATGPGFILTAGPPPVAFNCIMAARQAEQTRAEDPTATPPVCALAGNTDFVADARPWAQAAGIGCSVDQVAWIGRTSTGSDRYEIGCSNADGYWLEIAQNGTPGTRLSCLEIPANAGTCQFTTPAEAAAGVQAQLAGSPAADCASSQVRYMGANQNGRFYELKCASGDGRVVRLSNEGAFQQAYDCAQAANIGGGCALSDASAAVTATAEARVARLTELGYTCTVTNQRVIGQEPDAARREVSEFQCSDKPLGLVTFLPATGADGAEAIDCLTAKSRTLACQFTTDDQIKAGIGAMLQADGKACDVADYRITGRMAEGEGEVIEVKCADDRGYLGEFPASRDRAGQVQTCAQAAEVGDRCEL